LFFVDFTQLIFAAGIHSVRKIIFCPFFRILSRRIFLVCGKYTSILPKKHLHLPGFPL